MWEPKPTPERITERNKVEGTRVDKNVTWGVVNDKGDMMFFNQNLSENIFVNGSYYSAYFISEDVINKFNKNSSNGCKVYYNNEVGLYQFVVNGSDMPRNFIIKGSGRFPYTINRDYTALTNLKHFQEYNPLKPLKIKTDFEFTIGVEYETSAGYIPEHLCYRYGLIPVRDGSISGVEYASVVLNLNSLHLIKKHVELLSEYCEWNKDCSLHFHFGNLPVTEKFILNAYKLAHLLQDEFEMLLHPDAMDTTKFKSNTNKNYCAKLDKITTFDELYRYLTNTKYVGNLYLSLLNNQDFRHKWNMHSRYKWFNIINMCVFDKQKTCEFRCFNMTDSWNKVINWIFVCGAILNYAMRHDVQNKINIETIIRSTYSDNVSNLLIRFIEKNKRLNEILRLKGDSGGITWDLDKELYDENVLEVFE